MLVPNLIGAFSKFYLAGKLIKGMGALILGGLTLWWVVERVGPAEGTVLVHVTEPDVEVTLGGLNFSIEERRYAPLECRLRAGRHLLRVKRGDRMLYEEWFTVDRGEEVILTAYCPPEPGQRLISRGQTGADQRGAPRGKSGRHPDPEYRGDGRSGIR
jgi:hypothetical protein